MTNNEKWQGKPNSNASRDGKPYEKRDVKSILKGSKNAPKYNNERAGGSDNNYNNDRPTYNRRDDNSSQPERRYNGDRPNNNYGERRNNYGDRPNNSGDRPNYGNRSGNYGDRPNNYGDRPNNYGDRQNNYGDRRQNDGNQGGRPRFVVKKNNEGGNNNGERRYNNNNNFDRNQNSDKPFRRPRIQGQEGERERFQRPQQPRQDGGYIETRFDNRKDGVSFRKPKSRSGNYDPNAKYSQKKQYEYKNTQIDPTKPVRLNKFLANAGICSRREADEFIQAGVISVNGEVASELGVKILPTDRVMFHNQLVRSERKVYILLNKPKDCVTTSEDTHDRLTVLDLVKNACSERIYPVGRLDRNTTGIILLTNDGDLASKLTHPKFEKKKIYHVALDKPIQAADFETVLSGVVLDDEKIAADSLEFVKEGDFKQLGIEIHSGQNRVVRRIFEKLGYKVVRLDRVFFAGLTKKNLPRGKYRFLTEREVNMLRMGAYE